MAEDDISRTEKWHFQYNICVHSEVTSPELTCLPISLRPPLQWAGEAPTRRIPRSSDSLHVHYWGKPPTSSAHVNAMLVPWWTTWIFGHKLLFCRFTIDKCTPLHPHPLREGSQFFKDTAELRGVVARLQCRGGACSRSGVGSRRLASTVPSAGCRFRSKTALHFQLSVRIW